MKAHDLYRPFDMRIKNKDDVRKVIEAYRNRRTYVEWKKKGEILDGARPRSFIIGMQIAVRNGIFSLLSVDAHFKEELYRARLKLGGKSQKVTCRKSSVLRCTHKSLTRTYSRTRNCQWKVTVTTDSATL
jgi:hypothetical protein